MEKVIIYQVFTRLLGNRNTANIAHGDVAQNGTGKFNDFDNKGVADAYTSLVQRMYGSLESSDMPPAPTIPLSAYRDSTLLW